MFLNGFLLASLFYFFTEKQYEKKVFTSLAQYVYAQMPEGSSSAIQEDSLLINSVHLIHRLGVDRLAIFGDRPVKGVKAEIIQPVGVDLMTAQGACGSHAYMLARLLQEMNVDVRIPQMTVDGQSAGHIIVEAKTSHGWVVLDGLSNAYFKKPDGMLAGFADVQQNWASYQQQVSADYNMAYRYESARYTNWDKIPVIMPLIKNVMYWTMGREETDSYSIRSLGLNKYGVFFNITLCAYLLVILFSVNVIIKQRHRRQDSTAAIKPEEPVHASVSA